MGQSLLDFSGYIKFFVGLFALVNPVGIFAGVHQHDQLPGGGRTQ
ncbi:Uncharacterised protein [Serratia plymuthica]|uniref:Uncharacterized protein n=1 Tax=Serratia plymuthica TaxID=82996 RepID=A0A2X4XYD4_SERPL|nr:Uncharacterised protein [Serratia plymuthica]